MQARVRGDHDVVVAAPAECQHLARPKLDDIPGVHHLQDLGKRVVRLMSCVRHAGHHKWAQYSRPCTTPATTAPSSATPTDNIEAIHHTFG